MFSFFLQKMSEQITKLSQTLGRDAIYTKTVSHYYLYISKTFSTVIRTTVHICLSQRNYNVIVKVYIEYAI